MRRTGWLSPSPIRGVVARALPRRPAFIRGRKPYLAPKPQEPRNPSSLPDDRATFLVNDAGEVQCFPRCSLPGCMTRTPNGLAIGPKRRWLPVCYWHLTIWRGHQIKHTMHGIIVVHLRFRDFPEIAAL